jgi:hypothetical protein
MKYQPKEKENERRILDQEISAHIFDDVDGHECTTIV